MECRANGRRTTETGIAADVLNRMLEPRRPVSIRM
jgi:hypothetical protein